MLGDPAVDLSERGVCARLAPFAGPPAGTRRESASRLEFEPLQQFFRLQRGRGRARHVDDGSSSTRADEGQHPAARQPADARGRRRQGGRGAARHRRARRAVEGGHAIGPSTIDAVLAALDAAKDPREIFEDVVWRHRGKKITPKTVNQHYVDAIRSGTITFGPGPAGTGRRIWRWPSPSPRSRRPRRQPPHPHAACGGGRRAARFPARRHARQGRPVPAPAFDALYDMLDADRLNAFMERGRSRSPASRSCAAARSTTPSSSSTRRRTRRPSRCRCSSTRLGFGSKVVVTGDVTQIDLPQGQASGLIHVRQILGDIDGIEFVEFGNQDVVRHVLVQRIVEAYKATPRDGHAAAPVICKSRSPTRAASPSTRLRPSSSPGACSPASRSRTATSASRSSALSGCGAEARAPRNRRGDRRPLLPDRRARQASGRRAAPAR